jgi:hypothetical protein
MADLPTSPALVYGGTRAGAVRKLTQVPRT